MRKFFRTALMMAAMVPMVGASIAQAVDFKFDGEIRPRFEYRNENLGLNSGGSASWSWFTQRTRLGATATMDDSTSAYIQLQANSVWGDSNGASPNGGAFAQNPAGNGISGVFNSNQGTSAGTTVTAHQAYFTTKNFLTLPVILQAGRQEIALDEQELLGNANWTQGARSHDSILLIHPHGDLTLIYGFVDDVRNAQPQNDTNVMVHAFYGALANVLGGTFSMTYIYANVDMFNTAATVGAVANAGSSTTYTTTGTVTNPADIHTIGAHQAGHLDQFWGLDYKAEVYGQFGSLPCAPSLANLPASAGTIGNVAGYLAPLCTGVAAGTLSENRSAYMYALRLGKTFTDVTWKPSATIYWKHLSGDDGRSHDFNAFTTIADTPHDAFGAMDKFVMNLSNLGGGGLNGTDFHGLMDLKFAFTAQPTEKVTLGLNIHDFWTDITAGGRTGDILTGVNGVAANDSHLGEELDLNAKWAYNPFITISGGYSHFFADRLYGAIAGRTPGTPAATAIPGLPGGPTTAASALASGGTGGADWLYVMFDVKF